MIVSTDFLDHWKTRLLIQLLDDPEAPFGLVRLWGHCQSRKIDRFDPGRLNPSILKAITQSKANKEALWNAFLECRFLDLHEDGSIEIHGFREANATLFSNWGNGKKGGRPPKEKPDENPAITQPEPKEEKDEEGKEKINKQGETGDEEPAHPFSPASRKPAFWNGKDYSKAEVPEIRSYEDIHRIKDPIVACMAVSGDHGKGMYGFLIKGLQKSLDAGLSEETLKDCLHDLCARLFGELKTGERQPGKIAPALIAEMRDFFQTVDYPAQQRKETL